MTTVLLLLPVAAVLAWLYCHSLPGGETLGAFDFAVFGAVALPVVAWIAWAGATEFHSAGAIYSELVAAAGAYPILLTGLAIGLAWRHRSFRQRERAR